MDPSADSPPVLVYRAIPTDPAVRSSNSLFLTEASPQGGAPTRRLLYWGAGPAPARVAEAMGVRLADPLLTRRRLMAVDGVPVRLAISFFPPDLPEAVELTGDGFVEGGLQQVFDRHGRRFGRAEETLVARMPYSEEAEILEIDAGEPVVEILRTSYDDQGRAVHVLQTICVASRHVFVIRQIPGDAVF